MDGSVACPLQTRLPHSWLEHARPGVQPPELRAYKLGKKRWSYNQVDLVLGEEGGSRTAAVQQALHAGGAKFPEAHQDSAVGFLIQLESGQKLQAQVYLCYDRLPGDCATGGGSHGRGPATVPGSDHFAWNLVTRKHCCKGCEGRVLRSIQRFGRLGKRCRGGDAKPAAPTEPAADGKPAPAAGQGSRKDPRYMYLSLDEACTHVDATAFRLVAGIYNRQGTRLLTTTVSPPIRVLANNDVPTGAARITLEARLPADWEGWGSDAAGQSAARALATPRGRKGAASASRRKLVLKTPTPGSPANLTVATPMPIPRLPALACSPSNPALPLARTSSMRQLARQQQQQHHHSQHTAHVPQSSAHGCGEAEPLLLPGATMPSSLRRTLTGLAPNQASLLACGSVESTGEAGGSLLRHVGSSTIKQEHAADADYSLERCSAMTAGRLSCLEMESLCTAAPHGCPEPPDHWLAPAAPADISAVAAGFVPEGDTAAQAEAERQLRLLRELKAKLLAASNQAASSGCEVASASCTVPAPAPSCAGRAPLPLEQEQVSPSMGAPASPSARDWPPAAAAATASDTLLPAASLMEDNLGLPLLGCGSGGFSEVDEEQEQLHTMMMPGHHEPPAIEMLDMRMLPLFDDVLAA